MFNLNKYLTNKKIKREYILQKTLPNLWVVLYKQKFAIAWYWDTTIELSNTEKHIEKSFQFLNKKNYNLYPQFWDETQDFIISILKLDPISCKHEWNNFINTTF
jgi:hypothetical protein